MPAEVLSVNLLTLLPPFITIMMHITYYRQLLRASLLHHQWLHQLVVSTVPFLRSSVPHALLKVWILPSASSLPIYLSALLHAIPNNSMLGQPVTISRQLVLLLLVVQHAKLLETHLWNASLLQIPALLLTVGMLLPWHPLQRQPSTPLLCRFRHSIQLFCRFPHSTSVISHFRHLAFLQIFLFRPIYLPLEAVKRHRQHGLHAFWPIYLRVRVRVKIWKPVLNWMDAILSTLPFASLWRVVMFVPMWERPLLPALQPISSAAMTADPSHHLRPRQWTFLPLSPRWCQS